MTPWRPVRLALLATSAVVPLALAVAVANPLGPAVVSGTANVTGTGTANVTVNQTTQNAIINWQTFNLNAGDVTRFIQPNSTAMILNRVTGQMGPSSIYGTITANGRVFIVNPDGILIGRGATINTAGFLATTHDIANADFMANRLNFNIPGRPDASIVNEGIITATNGGFAALVAPGVRNSGTITANFGRIGLAAANGFTLDLYGDQLITLGVNDTIAAQVRDVATGLPLSALVRNDGLLRANGGRVELTAAAARVVVDSVINTSGVIEARTIGRRDGRIVLSAATAATKPAGAPQQTVRVSGRLTVASKKSKAGTVRITGENIQLVNANIDATGYLGGGTVLIGGDIGGGVLNPAVAQIPQAHLQAGPVPRASTVTIDGTTVINASATHVGNGGTVVVWADQSTTFAGTILARGGNLVGNGGFVEVSGKQTLTFSGLVNTLAPNGRAGTLLLDPADYTIGGSENGPNSMTVATLQYQLASNNVLIATGTTGPGDGDIVVNSSVTWSSNSTLTLSAYRDIELGPGVTISNTAAGNLVLRADSTGTGIGTLELYTSGMAPPARIDFTNSTGTIALYYNPVAFGTPDVFPNILLNSSVQHQFTAYMLVNDVAHLQNISINLAGNYALGRDINASETDFHPIGSVGNPFTGVFDGLGHTISKLAIAPTSADVFSIGLFAAIGTGGVVRNLNLTSVTVTANPNVIGGQFIGTLAGVNYGTIDNVTVSGTLDGGNLSGVIAGGLVGQNGPFGQQVVTATISNSTATVNVTVGDGCNTPTPGCNGFNLAGGLVGSNVGTITMSSAHGDIIGGTATILGGLVGSNQNSYNQEGEMVFLPTPLIDQSFATGNVSSAGTFVILGGLVGFNAPQAIIRDSQAYGNVTATANLLAESGDCNVNPNCQFVVAGGLVGQNFGTIMSTTPVVPSPFAGCDNGFTCASGIVSVGARAVAGGLVGNNDGIILGAFATGAVLGVAGPGSGNLNEDTMTTLGGLVGQNSGTILLSFASGDVGGLNVANLRAGGLVGDNSGLISGSIAFGNVMAGAHSFVGGFVASSGFGDFTCASCFTGDGHNTSASIAASTAYGNVTAGPSSIAGGFAGAADGTFFLVTATGNVLGGDNSFLGGLIGAFVISDSNLPGFLLGGLATGSVTSTGPNSIVGGLIGVNSATIVGGIATGSVFVTSNSIAGGLVGVNLGTIVTSATDVPNSENVENVAPNPTVTATGPNNVVGGLVGVNFGVVSDSTSISDVVAGPNSIAGGLIGANATFVNMPPGLFPTASLAQLLPPGFPPPESSPDLPANSFPSGTVSNSTAFGTVTAGPGSTTGPQVASNNPSSLPAAYPSIIQTCDNVTCVVLRDGQLTPSDTPTPPAPPPPPVTNNPPPPPDNGPPVVLTSLTPPAGPGPGSAPNPGPGVPQGQPFAPPQFSRPTVAFDGTRVSGLPPLNETRFFNNEIVFQVRAGLTDEEIRRLAQQFGLTVVSIENLPGLGRRAIRFRIGGGRSVRDVIAQADRNPNVIASPNYQFVLTQAPAQPPAQAPASLPPVAAPDDNRGDPAQYVLGKFHVHDVHRIASGTNVIIAVVDSEVDKDHPELAGAISQRFDAVGVQEKPHSHGTAMVGAIVARDRLLGLAPRARILTVRSFAESQTTAEGTTFNILKGIEWAVSQGARVINMSFAGPYDPALEKALKAAYDKGVVLVAAAGNAGPNSPPLFPGADAHVIGVTATDDNDKAFKGANVGGYISVAAPGVEILAPAPQDSYQMSTGTSIATAHVTAVVALMIERDATLKPDEVRQILQETASDLGVKGKDNQFGWGLVNPQKALAAVEARKKSPTATTKP